MSESKGQEGKDITIYANFNPELRTRDWLGLFQDITQKLVDGDVRPGYRAPRNPLKPEKPLQGSNYITYRYKDEFGERRKKENIDLLKRLSEETNQDTGSYSRGWPNFDAIAKIAIKVNDQGAIPIFVSKSEPLVQDQLSEEHSNKLR